MGIHCHLIQIPDGKLMQLDEEAIPKLFDEVGCLGTSTREELRRYEVADEPRLPISELNPDEPRRPIPALSLDKGWIELHLFLTGKEPWGPKAVDESSLISQAIIGGREVGQPLHFMNPARCHWADEVSRIAEALSTLRYDDLRRRFHDPTGYPPEVFKQIMHPFHTDDEIPNGVAFYAVEDLDHAFCTLIQDFDRLTAYYRIAAMRGNAMLIGFL